MICSSGEYIIEVSEVSEQLLCIINCKEFFMKFGVNNFNYI